MLNLFALASDAMLHLLLWSLLSELYNNFLCRCHFSEMNCLLLYNRHSFSDISLEKTAITIFPTATTTPPAVAGVVIANYYKPQELMRWGGGILIG